MITSSHSWQANVIMLILDTHHLLPKTLPLKPSQNHTSYLGVKYKSL